MNELEILVKDFVKIHVILFKTIQRNSATYYDYKKILDIIVYDDQFKTYKDVFNFYKEKNKNETINHLLKKLEHRFYLIENVKFGLTSKDLLPIDYKINSMFYCGIIKLIAHDVNIKLASELTGITEAAIKQACQQERLLSVYKIGKTWVVNLYEVSEYWGCSIKKYKD